MGKKTVVVTGATSGVGFEAAVEFARRGWQVIGAGRRQEAVDAALEEILRRCPDAQVCYFCADLSLMGEVRQLASKIRDYLSRQGDGSLDALVNNAATVSSWFMLTQEGMETQFAVNHMSGFLLTKELEDALLAAKAPRVVCVSSESHRHAKIYWQDVMMQRNYHCLRAYKQSKLCNLLFIDELARRNAHRKQFACFCVDPGLVRTEIGLKGTGGLEKLVWKWRMRGGVAPQKPAVHIVSLVEMESEGLAGHIYFKDGRPKEPDKKTVCAQNAARLWELSERLCGK